MMESGEHGRTEANGEEGTMAAGSEEKVAARARLEALRGRGSDSELISQTLADLRERVEEREPPADAEAIRVASYELHQMRAEERAKEFVSAHRKP